MTTYKHSLRLKLLCLLALTVAAAVLPFALYTARGLEQRYLESAWRDIRNTSETIEAALEAQYQVFLTNEILKVLLKKEELRKIGLLLRHTWDDLDTLIIPRRETIIANQIRSLGSLGILVGWVEAGTEPQKPLGPLVSPADWENIRDIAGRPLKTLIVNPALIRSGAFIVFQSAWAEGHPPGFFLLHMIPTEAHPGTLFIMMSLDDLFRVHRKDLRPGPRAGEGARPRKALDSVALGLKDNFKNLTELRPGTSISLLDGGGENLAQLGTPLPDHPWPDLMPEARRLGQVEKVLEPAGAGPTIARLVYFPPLEAFVLLTLPESSISGPARAIVRGIIWLGLLVMGLVLAAGFYFSVRLTGPLNLLTARTIELAKADFSRPETISNLLGGLPLDRSDEVGRLARAFARLGQDLGRNIEERLTATSAKERLEGELGVARDIQMGMLPAPDSLPPDFRGQIQGFLMPAKEVGGDFYDFFPAPDGRLAVVIGDVSDKGAPAALFMAMTVTLIRQTIENGLSPAATLTQINDQLLVKNPEGLFVTLFLGLLDLSSGEMEFANGGHCPPLLVGGPEGARHLEGLSGLVLGAWPGQGYEGFKTTLPPEVICVLYTDGVTEAQDSEGSLFGLDRLEETAVAGKNLSPAEMNRRIYEATLNFRGPAQPSDDLTLLSFCLRPPPGQDLEIGARKCPPSF